MGGQYPKSWNRDTPWRQGRVLRADSAEALGLKNSIDELATVVVVISHDCDLAIDNLNAEPEVEVIVGRRVKVLDGNFAWGKAPRTLHLSMATNGDPVNIELTATSKRLVPKNEMADYAPDDSLALDAQGLAVLRGWLSARYNRTAFPDTFVKRMQETKLDQRLPKILGPHGDLISFVYFDIDSGLAIERPINSPYELSIVLVYPPGDDPDATAEAVDGVVEDIEQACEQRLKTKTEIVLKKCIGISEDDISVSQARVLMQWRLEHMTYKADSDEPGPLPV